MALSRAPVAVAVLVLAGCISPLVPPPTQQSDEAGGGELGLADGASPPTPGLAVGDVHAFAETPQSIVVTWSLAAGASVQSRIEHGVDESYGQATATVEGPGPHLTVLEGLAPATAYHLRVVAASLGQVAASPDQVVQTPAEPDPLFPLPLPGPSEELAQPLQPDAVPPTIKGIAVDAGPTSAYLDWDVEDASGAASSHAEHGTTPAYGNATPEQEGAGHQSALLASLLPATVYHYRIVARDGAGNSASVEGSFTTAAAAQEPSSPPPSSSAPASSSASTTTSASPSPPSPSTSSPPSSTSPAPSTSSTSSSSTSSPSSAPSSSKPTASTSSSSPTTTSSPPSSSSTSSSSKPSSSSMSTSTSTSSQSSSSTSPPADRIRVDAVDAPLSLPFSLQVQGSGNARIKDLAIASSAGTASIGGQAADLLAYKRIAWPEYQYVLYQVLAVQPDRWTVLWLYCSGAQLRFIYSEDTKGAPMASETASGTCTDSGTSQPQVRLPATDMAVPSLLPGYRITGPGLDLQGASRGRIVVGGEEHTLLAFGEVDCTKVCGGSGWYELHALLWRPGSRQAAFGILYLMQGNPDAVSLHYGLRLPDLKPMDATFNAHWTRG